MSLPFQLRACNAIDEIAADQWDALHSGHPFVRHGLLSALERHGAVATSAGWQPLHLTLHRQGRLRAAMPVYVKSHSHGEFVFDWAWADAAEQLGIEYYPKLLCAIPFSPVQGPRLLTGEPTIKRVLAKALIHVLEQLRLSSIHVNFVDDEDAAALGEEGFLERIDWQFHWRNNGYRDFEDFLAALTHKKRKNIRQERNRLRQQGWTFEHIPGDQAEAWHWRFMHRLYHDTFERKGNWALFSAQLFQDWGRDLGGALILVLAKHHTEYRAAALLFRSADTLYGRYWGCIESTPGLHFETCYYQGIDFAIAHGLQRFDPGAQGEHKIARGFLPTKTRSFHYIRDPHLRSLISTSLAAERAHRGTRGETLTSHSPYRTRPP